MKQTCLSFQGGIFSLKIPYARRAIAKQKGFRWSPNEKKWLTRNLAVARQFQKYADASALSAFKAHQAKLDLSSAIDSKIQVPSPDGLNYLPFQKAGIEFCAKKPKTLLADEPGLGKTIQSCGVINLCRSQGDPLERILIVCPTSVRLNWLSELKKWLIKKDQRITILDKPPSEYEAQRSQWPAGIVIINYHGLTRYPWLAWLRWDLCIFDEAHMIKNPKAQRSLVAYCLANATPRLMLLTGTPLMNKPIEIQPLASLCDPTRFGHYMNFAKRYCNAHQQLVARSTKVWSVDGASNLQELQERLRASIMIRRLKSDVLSDLPAKTRQLVVLNVDTSAIDTNIQVDDWISAMQAATYESSLSKLVKVTVGFEEMSKYRHDVGTAKIAKSIEWINDMLGSVDKLIVFAHHQDVIQAIAAHFADIAVTAYGPVSADKRQEAVERFQTDPSVKLFIGGIHAAGTGITLTAASHVAFVELDWVPANTTQAEDRCHRVGQKSAVNVYHLVADRTLDPHMADILIEKQILADDALNIPSGAPLGSPPPQGTEPLDGGPEPTPPPEPAVSVPRQKWMLSRLVCLSINKPGFNKFDRPIGSNLATRDKLTKKQYDSAQRMTAKYEKRLKHLGAEPA